MRRIAHPPNSIKNIEYILKRLNSTTKQNILKWININEDILEDDLKLIGGMKLQIYIINRLVSGTLHTIDNDFLFEIKIQVQKKTRKKLFHANVHGYS